MKRIQEDSRKRECAAPLFLLKVPTNPLMTVCDQDQVELVMSPHFLSHKLVLLEVC